MTHGCHRCGPKVGIFTLQRVHDMDGKVMDVEVYLCRDCRLQAGQENAAAMSRRSDIKGTS